MGSWGLEVYKTNHGYIFGLRSKSLSYTNTSKHFIAKLSFIMYP